MKKIIAIATIAGFVLSAGVASASCIPGFCPNPTPEPVVSNVTVNTNNSDTNVGNVVVTVAKTGKNTSNGGLIVTGNAYADSYAGNDVNSTNVNISAPCADCGGDVKVNTTNSDINVGNVVVTAAKTGGNSIMSMPSMQMPCRRSRTSNDGGVILTGNATAVSYAVNVVNGTVVRITR